MLSREDRILSELIVSRGLATPETVERHARELEDSDEHGLVQMMVSQGQLDAETGRLVQQEAQEIDGLLRPDVPEGTKLGEFRLVREIGRGGMGIVYEAEQESLGRRVALKLLPAGAALDERLAIRFLREARTAARLSHPGIVPVFGTGREQGVLFFAMELIDGESLAERIARGPLQAQEAARIAAEVAHALQHAHDAGLIHRDVKPENVMLGADGRSRLADFGLVHDLEGARLTRSHYVLGTPAYSAPEQARGEPVDPRSDVYGAAAVLYAMLCGNPPFTGEVPAAVLGRLINEAPPSLAGNAPEAPPELIAICEKAMSRDKGQRYPTAGALAEALDGFLEGDGESPGVPGAKRTISRPAMVASLLAAALALGIWAVGVRDSQRESESAAGSDTLPAVEVGLLRGDYRPFPNPKTWTSMVALSPDGEVLAYAAGATAEQWRIYLQREDEPEPRRLIPDDVPQTSPAWSHDGARIAYCKASQIEILELATGVVDSTGVLCERKLSWSPDGTRIVYADRRWPMTRLRVLDIATRTSKLISAPGTDHPSWGPGGRIAYIALRGGTYDVWTFRDDGTDPLRVTEDVARELHPVWASTADRLYFGSNRDEVHDLWEARLDPRTGEPLSAPTPVSSGWIGPYFVLSGAIRRDRLALVQASDPGQRWAMQLGDGAALLDSPRRLTVDIPFYAQLPQRAPGRDDWVAAASVGSSRGLRRYGAEAGHLKTGDGSYRDGAPRWSPDGSLIAFHSDRSGVSEIWTVPADGNEASPVTDTGRDARFPVWSPDGRQLAYTLDGSGPWVVNLSDGSTVPPATPDDRSVFEGWSWSADGKRIAGTASGISFVDLETGRFTRVSDFGEKPLWFGDSNELLFTYGDGVFHWDGGEPREIFSTEPSRLVSGLSLDPDRQVVYYAAQGSKEQVWIVDLDTAITE